MKCPKCGQEAANLVLNLKHTELSELTFKWGKHKDKKLSDVYLEDPGYLNWAKENVKNDWFKSQISTFLDIQNQGAANELPGMG